MGHTPQFTAVTLYSTTGQVVCTGSQVKSTLFPATSERWTFSGGGGGSVNVCKMKVLSLLEKET